jgi:hypothetical protein
VRDGAWCVMCDLPKRRENERGHFKIENDCSQWIFMESKDLRTRHCLMDKDTLAAQLMFN